MARLMIFIDGSWLYYSKAYLAEKHQKQDFFIDYGRLPEVLSEVLREQGGLEELDLVRSHLYGSYAWNPDEGDVGVVNKQRDFFDMLRDRYFYEVEVFPVDFKGRKVSRIDRPDDDDFVPREHSVEVSLAASMMYYAGLPNSCDIAMILAGDRDYVPLMRRVRQLGGRVAVASIRRQCCSELSDANNRLGVKDFPTIWLDDYVDRLELKMPYRRTQCESSLHDGDREVLATFVPKPGEKFYCDDCRRQYDVERKLHNEAPLQTSNYFDQSDEGETLSGIIKATFPERGFGFIAANNYCDYFFHSSDLESGVEIEDIQNGDPVVFDVRRTAATGKAGAARNIILKSLTAASEVE